MQNMQDRNTEAVCVIFGERPRLQQDIINLSGLPVIEMKILNTDLTIKDTTVTQKRCLVCVCLLSCYHSDTTCACPLTFTKVESCELLASRPGCDLAIKFFQSDKQPLQHAEVLLRDTREKCVLIWHENSPKHRHDSPAHLVTSTSTV